MGLLPPPNTKRICKANCLDIISFPKLFKWSLCFVNDSLLGSISTNDTCFTCLTNFSSYLLTLMLLTWRMWWANNASNWQMGFNLVFKWLHLLISSLTQDDFIKSKMMWYIQQDYVCMIVTLNEIYDISSTIHTVIFYPHH